MSSNARAVTGWSRAASPGLAVAFVALVALVAFVPARAAADGLRIGLSGATMKLPSPSATTPGETTYTDVFYSAISARVARGRAGLSVALPVIATTGNVNLVNDQVVAVGGEGGGNFGQSDLQVGLDYNVVQDRVNMFIVTLSTSLRVPSAKPGLGNGSYFLNVGASASYGITRQLIAFAEYRHSFYAVLTPTSTFMRGAELGAVYWFSEKLGLTAGLGASDYGGRRGLPGWSLEANTGLLFELFPGVMMNAGGFGGAMSLPGASGAGGGAAGSGGIAPQGGGSFGFGFEI